MKTNSKLARLSQGSRGFTLVELLLVLVILATLAAIVLPKIAGRGKQAQETAARTQINVFEGALDSFEVNCKYYPESTDGLDALVTQPANASGWHGPYLTKAVPTDPWGNAYVYQYPGKLNPTGYDIISGGPDGQIGSEDDITNVDVVKK